MDALFDTPDLPAACERCLRTSDICVCGDAYYEMFADSDQWADGVVFTCNACGTDVTWSPCAEHAPIEVNGLRLIVCEAENPHPRTWILAREEPYGVPCPWCMAKEAHDRHEGCEHAAHGRWRSWRMTAFGLSLLSRLGLASYGFRYGGGCEGCRTAIRFGWRRAR